MTDNNEVPLSREELAKRRFIRNQEDLIGRLIDKPARHGRGMFRRIELKELAVPTDLAIADNSYQLTEDGIREIAQAYLQKYHPELSLTRVRVDNLFKDGGHCRTDAVLYVRRRLYGWL